MEVLNMLAEILDSEILHTIFTVVILPLLGALTRYLVKLISKKIEHIGEQTNSEIAKRGINVLNEIVKTTVTSFNQQVVDDLKRKGEFTEDKQAEVFGACKNSILSCLKDSTINAIKKEYGDENFDDLVEKYINTYVNATKKKIADDIKNKTVDEELEK